MTNNCGIVVRDLTRLRAGDVVDLNCGYGEPREAEVILANFSRARVRPLGVQERTFKPLGGEERTIKVPMTAFDISPNSEIPILRRA